MKLQAQEELNNILEDIEAFPSSRTKRFVYRLLKNKTRIFELISAIKQLRKFDLCSICNYWRINQDCAFCNHLEDRDTSGLCIVQDQESVAMIERLDVFKGLYLVLKSAINVRQLGKSIIKLEYAQIEKFIITRKFKEVIFANDFTYSGEWTARYIRQELEKKYHEIKFTRISCGIPFGAELTILDDLTLQKAIVNRDEFRDITLF